MQLEERLLILLPIENAPGEGCSTDIVIVRRNNCSLETVFKTSGRNNFSKHWAAFSRSSDLCTYLNLKNVILVKDFNARMTESHLQSFRDSYG